MANAGTTRTALIQHNFGVLAIIIGTSIGDLQREYKANFREDFNGEMNDLPVMKSYFGDTSAVDSLIDGTLYITTDEILIAEYIND